MKNNEQDIYLPEDDLFETLPDDSKAELELDIDSEEEPDEMTDEYIDPEEIEEIQTRAVDCRRRLHDAGEGKNGCIKKEIPVY